MILSQKVRKGQDIPFFPHLTYLHTQEVTGSSPVSSTRIRKTVIHCVAVDSGFFVSHICCVLVVVWSLCLLLSKLHRQCIGQSISCASLGGLEGMGIDIQGRAGLIVALCGRDYPHILPVIDQQ